jgi:hypothetical protein
MEAYKKRKLLQCIQNIYTATKRNILDDALFEKIGADLKELSGYFEVSKMQAFFLANFFAMKYKEVPESITTIFKSTSLGYWKFMKHLEFLHSNPIHLKHISKESYMIAFRKKQFVINDEILNQFSLICKCRNCRN